MEKELLPFCPFVKTWKEEMESIQAFFIILFPSSDEKDGIM